MVQIDLRDTGYLVAKFSDISLLRTNLQDPNSYNGNLTKILFDLLRFTRSSLVISESAVKRSNLPMLMGGFRLILDTVTFTFGFARTYALQMDGKFVRSALRYHWLNRSYRAR